MAGRRGLAAVCVVAVSVTLLAVPVASARTLSSAAASTSESRSHTSALEAARVDRVATPNLGWYPCFSGAQCATAELPLDYDAPHGPTTTVAVLKIPAADPAHKIGSLFLNPGGPGGSGTQIASNAPYFLPQILLDRFDIVGVDPRGTNFSDNVRCFGTPGQQAAAFAGFRVPFPRGAEQRAAWLTSASELATGCSTTGAPLAASMSTAEVARDMDVLRRAVGDDKLSYLGFSYGSYLGQVYANMFPDRFRALVIDGVLDAVAWAGTPATKNTPVTIRLKSADGAYESLHAFLQACDRVGPAVCDFASGQGAVRKFDVLVKRLKKNPIDFGEGSLPLDYASFISSTLSLLYGLQGQGVQVGQDLQYLLSLTSPPATLNATQRATALAGVRDLLQRAKQATAGVVPTDFPYDNGLEAFSSVLCSDSLNPASPSVWPNAILAAGVSGRFFNDTWGWASPQCASSVWRAVDEDAYRGPFNANTVAPVLIVSSRHDPATPLAGAQKAAALLPNSRLIIGESSSHTAFFYSSCIAAAEAQYLVTAVLPPAGTRCWPDQSMFAGMGPSGWAPTKIIPLVPLVPLISLRP